MAEFKAKKKLDSKEKKRIPEEVINYYRNIKQQLSEGFQNDEQKELFVSNVFEQLVKEISQISLHQQTSFTIQELVQMANAEQLENALRDLIKNLDTIITNNYGSYVLQTALYRSTDFFDSNPNNVFVRQIHQIGMMLLERSELFTQVHSSHVIRSLVEVMGGVQAGKQIVQGKNSADIRPERYMKEHDLYEEFSDLLAAFSAVVLPSTESSSGLDVVLSPHTSALAQLFLLVFHEKNPQRCKEVCRSVLDSGCFSQMNRDGAPSIMAHQFGSYFCSALIKVMDRKSLGRLIKEVIVPSFDVLVNDMKANYVVQQAISSVKSDIQLGKVMKVLKGKLLGLLSRGRGGVVLNLFTAALNYPERQEALINALREEAGCSEETGGIENLKNNLILVLILGSKSDSLTEKEVMSRLRNTPYLSSMVIQKLFAFEDIEYVCTCLGALSTNQHIALGCSKFGSRVYNAYIDSDAPLKEKKAFTEKLQGACFHLVTDVYGSRVFDELWNIMSVPCKQKVMNNLGKSIAPIVGNRFGKVVAFKIHLQDFVHDRSTWDKWLAGENKSKKLLSVPTKRKRKSKVESDVNGEASSPSKKNRIKSEDV